MLENHKKSKINHKEPLKLMNYISICVDYFADARVIQKEKGKNILFQFFLVGQILLFLECMLSCGLNGCLSLIIRIYVIDYIYCH